LARWRRIEGLEVTVIGSTRLDLYGGAPEPLYSPLRSTPSRFTNQAPSSETLIVLGPFPEPLVAGSARGADALVNCMSMLSDDQLCTAFDIGCLANRIARSSDA
jgi:hypothetical protein